MPRPQFITCQICGKGFGSASISIHIPQCYEKALKRWKLDPTGPRPVMPVLPGSTSPGGALGKARATGPGGRGSIGANSDAMGFEALPPRGNGVAAARSLQSHGTAAAYMEAEPVNMNLHPCSKCGRKFNFDRIAYHESVCKGDQKRKAFDSRKQRRASAEEEDGGFGSYGRSTAMGNKGASKKTPGTATSQYKPAPAPQTNWRQQHEEFINAMRSAKQADKGAQDMWGTSSVAQSSRAPAMSRASPSVGFDRSGAGAGGLGRGDSTALARGMPAPSKRVPASMTMQSESRKQNIATGGRAALAKASAPAAASRVGATRPANCVPPQGRGSFGGPSDRLSSRGPAVGGGGGGGGRILNDNTTSVGMLQAMGRA